MPRWTAADISPQDGRTAIVTGANSGIGFHAARYLATAGSKGWDGLVLAGMNWDGCERFFLRIYQRWYQK